MKTGDAHAGDCRTCVNPDCTSYKGPLVKTGDAHAGVLQFVGVAVVVLSLAGDVQR